MNETSTNYVAVKELERLLKEDNTVTLIDARTAEEYGEGHVPEAINVPIANLTEFARNRDSDFDGLVITMCGSSGRGGKAATILASEGMKNVQILEGGLKAWTDASLPVA